MLESLANFMLLMATNYDKYDVIKSVVFQTQGS